MSTSSSPPSSANFDQFHVDFTTGELLRSGVRVPIQGQPFHVLRLLLEANGKVVTREQLRQALWPEDTFVDFELGVNTAVKKLRQSLEDSAEHPKLRAMADGLIVGDCVRCAAPRRLPPKN